MIENRKILDALVNAQGNFLFHSFEFMYCILLRNQELERIQIIGVLILYTQYIIEICLRVCLFQEYFDIHLDIYLIFLTVLGERTLIPDIWAFLCVFNKIQLNYLFQYTSNCFDILIHHLI